MRNCGRFREKVPVDGVAVGKEFLPAGPAEVVGVPAGFTLPCADGAGLPGGPEGGGGAGGRAGEELGREHS